MPSPTPLTIEQFRAELRIAAERMEIQAGVMKDWAQRMAEMAVRLVASESFHRPGKPLSEYSDVEVTGEHRKRMEARAKTSGDMVKALVSGQALDRPVPSEAYKVDHDIEPMTVVPRQVERPPGGGYAHVEGDPRARTLDYTPITGPGVDALERRKEHGGACMRAVCPTPAECEAAWRCLNPMSAAM